MTSPLKKIPAVAAATLLILILINSLLSLIYQHFGYYHYGMPSFLITFFMNSLDYLGMIMIAIGLLRGKRDGFLGTGFLLRVIYTFTAAIMTFIFRIVGYSPLVFGNMLSTLFLTIFNLFLAVVCFSKGKLQLKKLSFIFLIAGCVAALFPLLNMIRNISFFPSAYYAYDAWGDYYYDWALYNYESVLYTFRVVGPFLSACAFVCIGWAFMERNTQSRHPQVPYTQPEYTQPQFHYDEQQDPLLDTALSEDKDKTELQDPLPDTDFLPEDDDKTEKLDQPRL